ncbi:hypothetical protein ACTXT7_017576 [Hymenolepis weldensis]
MHTKFPPTVMVYGVVVLSVRVNADADADAGAGADAYVETLQSIVVKANRMDSMANGGRPAFAFQQDSSPFLKALKMQN